ncbi:MAG: hypothetical protein FWF81_05800 [Defluviitaleaceae bacterium]|nr:hypothetical protein [Defluviitaleaceae bacterium]
MIILKHYIKRAFLDPIGVLVFVLMPIIFITVMYLLNMDIEGYYHIVNGYNTVSTGNVIANMLVFQFMGGTYIIDYVYLDFKSDRRWRLLSAQSLNKYLLYALAACVMFSMVSSLIVLGVGYFFLNAYVGNIIMILAVVLCVALFGQLLGIFLSLFVKKKSTCEGILMASVWIMFILSGFMFGIEIPVFGGFMQDYGTPAAVAIHAIFQSGLPALGVSEPDMNRAYLSLAILVGFTAAIAVAVFVAGRRKPL